MSKTKILFVILVSVMLSACGGNKLNGNYATLEGAYKFHFNKDGRVAQSMMGNIFAEYDYEKNDNEVRIYMIEGTAQVFIIQDDGSLVGPAGLRLTKVD